MNGNTITLRPSILDDLEDDILVMGVLKRDWSPGKGHLEGLRFNFQRRELTT